MKSENDRAQPRRIDVGRVLKIKHKSLRPLLNGSCNYRSHVDVRPRHLARDIDNRDPIALTGTNLQFHLDALERIVFDDQALRSFFCRRAVWAIFSLEKPE